MTKLKTPLLSFEAHGSIAGGVTIQKRSGVSFARRKPTPTQPNTLLQAYQRWLYSDYAYLWKRQTPAVKQQYASNGARFHLTGYQYWLKSHLSDLPDIVLGLHLDYITAGKVTDWSRYLNDGTVFGASLVDGFIGKCLSFDKIDDYVNLGNPAQYQDMSLFTFECLFNMPSLVCPEVYQFIVSKTNWYNQGFGLAVFPDGRLRFYLHDPGARNFETAAGVIIENTTYHLAALMKPLYQRVYLNNTLVLSNNFDYVPDNVTPLRIGTGGPVLGRFGGRMDNIILYNRLLDTTEIERHSERRYPL